jgi:hypothetical protein
MSSPQRGAPVTLHITAAVAAIPCFLSGDDKLVDDGEFLERASTTSKVLSMTSAARWP